RYLPYRATPKRLSIPRRSWENDNRCNREFGEKYHASAPARPRPVRDPCCNLQPPCQHPSERRQTPFELALPTTLPSPCNNRGAALLAESAGRVAARASAPTRPSLQTLA